MTPLKVLYLTPPAKSAAALAAQSFIEEEIRAIRTTGVTPFVLTDEAPGCILLDGVALEGMETGRLSSMAGPSRLVARHPRLIAHLARTATPRRDIVHALRIENAAAQLITREGIDLVHSHFGWPAGLGGSLAAHATGRPLVASMRGTDVLVRADLGYGLRLEPSYDIALAHLFRSASRVLVATRFMSKAAAGAGAPPHKIRVLEKGVDLERFRPAESRVEIRTPLGIAGLMVLAVGNLQRRKGFESIIDAFAALGRPDSTLVICGTGDRLLHLQAEAEARGIGNQVRFDGHVPRDRITDYFAAADVFVHAAELEAAGNVVLEALACAAAVVVTDSGGPGEYVDDGVNGFVIQVGDSRALADRFSMLLDNAALRERMGRAGRARVEQRHAYPRMMAGLRAVYDEIAPPASRSQGLSAKRGPWEAVVRGLERP